MSLSNYGISNDQIINNLLFRDGDGSLVVPSIPALPTPTDTLKGNIKRFGKDMYYCDGSQWVNLLSPTPVYASYRYTIPVTPLSSGTSTQNFLFTAPVFPLPNNSLSQSDSTYFISDPSFVPGGDPAGTGEIALPAGIYEGNAVVKVSSSNEASVGIANINLEIKSRTTGTSSTYRVAYGASIRFPSTNFTFEELNIPLPFNTSFSTEDETDGINTIRITVSTNVGANLIFSGRMIINRIA